MLIPKERPYLEGLNSHYLHLERFIEHLQGDIGSGAVHCISKSLEMLIYFTETEIVSSLIHEKGREAHYVPAFEIARGSFYAGNFMVSVYQLDAHAIFFWAQMPPFQWAKSTLKSNEITLPDLISRLRQKQFSGFIEVKTMNKSDSAILFFHEGDRIGGSYSWGKGGMNTTDDAYNSLLSRVQATEGVFTFGNFIKE